MKFLHVAIAAFVLLFANACGKTPMHEKIAATDNEAVQSLIMDTVALPAANQERSPGQTSGSSNENWDKKIVRNATLNVEVENYQAYNTALHDLARKWEAYISSEEENSSSYKIESVVTIRVPVQYFDEAMQQLSPGKSKVLVKQITTQDVTGDYVDTKTRMESKRKVRLRYLDMLQKAKNMEEVLAIEREVNAIQEQIEAAEGRLTYLGHSAAYSTIQLTFFQVLDAGSGNPEQPGFGSRVLSALGNGWKWSGELLLVLINLWPVWVGITLLVWVIRRMTATRGLSSKAPNP